MTPQEAFDKSCYAGKRLPELEDVIMTDPWLSYVYAEYVIEGRWIEAEDIIMNSSIYSYYYAIYVIKGKLPDKMHNMMMLYAIKDPNDMHVKQYFEYIAK